MAKGIQHTPTDESREVVTNLAIAGFPQNQICKALGLGERTLQKHYSDELRKGALLATAAVAGKLYDKAIGGDTTACIFWMKTRAGWREKAEVDVTSSDGSMAPPRIIQVIGVDAKK